jgi:predicted ATPase
VMDLLERSSLLEELSAMLAATAAGGRVVLLAGEAGIGKSALVKRFTQRQSADARFLLGACDPLLTPRALGPLHDIARHTGGRLAELLASGGHGRPSSLRSWTSSRSRRGGRRSWWRTCTGPTRRPLTC